jgi:hypothetical protein
MWGPTFPELVEALRGIDIIDRSSVNAFSGIHSERKSNVCRRFTAGHDQYVTEKISPAEPQRVQSVACSNE